MSFAALLLLSTLTAWIVVLAVERRAPGLQRTLRLGLAATLVIAGTLNLWRLGLKGVVASCPDPFTCLVLSRFADAIYQLLNAAFLAPRSFAPLTGWIIFLEMGWRLVSQASDPLVPIPMLANPLGDRLFEIGLAAWALYASDSLPAAARLLARIGVRRRRRVAPSPEPVSRSTDDQQTRSDTT
ncbi:hypothetical protein [Caulobacter mirabilis]|uniref:Uncharacterized protein n=1 Tax=Caulobacter mirabilis TaxID=69666 RepID=A0A2D2AUI5_9CAUL|nr:hypothetical protein [Caulobacter mirabilis]ATQ41682.1 hypothetical protein CSW64_04270 [Caulobacter mirabilis]